MTMPYQTPEAPPAAAPAGPEAALTQLIAPPPPTANEGSHPNAISPDEGLPTVDQAKLLKMLQKMLKLKYTGVILYMNYGDRLRAHFRDTVYKHFKEHMKEERQGAYDLAMKITALGGEPTPQVGQVPDCAELHMMFGHIMTAELELIKTGREILAVCGEYVGLRVLIENMVLQDQQHLDDARRMMIHEG